MQKAQERSTEGLGFFKACCRTVYYCIDDVNTAQTKCLNNLITAIDAYKKEMRPEGRKNALHSIYELGETVVSHIPGHNGAPPHDSKVMERPDRTGRIMKEATALAKKELARIEGTVCLRVN